VRKLVVVLLWVALLNLRVLPVSSASQTSGETARGIVAAAIAAMGGEDKLRALKSLRIEGVGHINFLEQSERPEGPWIVGYEQFTELRDLTGGRLQRAVESRSIQTPQWRKGPTVIFAGGVAAMQFGSRVGPGSWLQVQEAQEALALSPERALLTALGAKDLHTERETTLQGVRQHVVAFSWLDATARLYLNTQTNLPTAVEVVRAYPGDFFWGVWGEVRTRTYLSLWMLEPGGIRYPHQWNIERNGMPYKEFTATALSLNAPLPEDAFSISEDVRKGFAARGKRIINELPLGIPTKPTVEIAPGLVDTGRVECGSRSPGGRDRHCRSTHLFGLLGKGHRRSGTTLSRCAGQGCDYEFGCVAALRRHAAIRSLRHFDLRARPQPGDPGTPAGVSASHPSRPVGAHPAETRSTPCLE